MARAWSAERRGLLRRSTVAVQLMASDLVDESARGERIQQDAARRRDAETNQFAHAFAGEVPREAGWVLPCQSGVNREGEGWRAQQDSNLRPPA